MTIKDVQELKTKIDQLKILYKQGKTDVEKELRAFQRELKQISKEFCKNLSPWDRVSIARHNERPQTLDYIKAIFKNFVELHGDRCYGDDPAIISGFAKFYNNSVCIIGHQKGRDTKDKIYRNFGMAHPEGYRKAQRIMKLAEKFQIPIITFVDTAGAYPGIGAEERGQAQAIATSIELMGSLKTHIITIIIGEGGSGGALGLAVADKILMLENAWYSVISPEGCAAILYKDQSKVQEATKSLKITAQDLHELGVIDCIIPEPYCGAHMSHRLTFYNVKFFLRKALNEVLKYSIDEIVQKRHDRYLNIGFYENA